MNRSGDEIKLRLIGNHREHVLNIPNLMNQNNAITLAGLQTTKSLLDAKSLRSAMSDLENKEENILLRFEIIK